MNATALNMEATLSTTPRSKELLPKGLSHKRPSDSVTSPHLIFRAKTEPFNVFQQALSESAWRTASVGPTGARRLRLALLCQPWFRASAVLQRRSGTGTSPDSPLAEPGG